MRYQVIGSDGAVTGTARIFSGVAYMDGCGDNLAVLSLNSAAVLKKDGTVLNLNETPTGTKLEEIKEIVIDKAKAFVEEFKDVAAQNGAFQKEEPYNSPWPEDHAQEEASEEPEAPAEDDTPAE